LLTTEWLLLATIMVIGLVPGLIALRQGVLSELVEFAQALMGLDQSYSFTGNRLVCPAHNTRGVEERGLVGENAGWDNSRPQGQGALRSGEKGVAAGKWQKQGVQHRLPLAWTAGSAADNRPIVDGQNLKSGPPAGTVCNECNGYSGTKLRLESVPPTPRRINSGPCN
jgi:hypothetical protein